MTNSSRTNSTRSAIFLRLTTKYNYVTTTLLSHIEYSYQGLSEAQLEVMLKRAARSVLVQPRDAKHTILKRRRQP